MTNNENKIREKILSYFIAKPHKIQYNKIVFGGVMVSTLYQKYKKRVVDPWPLKKRENKINADNKELAFAAQSRQRLTKYPHIFS